MRYWLISLILLLPLLSFTQEEEEWRVIPSLHDWVEEINNWPDIQYAQQFIEVHIDPVKDKGYFEYNIRGDFYLPLDSGKVLSKLQINKKVDVNNIHIRHKNIPYSSNDVHLMNLEFNREFFIYNLRSGRLGFKNCIFNEYVQIRRINSAFFLRFSDCHFKNGMRFNNPDMAVELEFLRTTADQCGPPGEPNDC